MGQFMFFALFIIAAMAGAFAYFAPQQQAINPLKFAMETSGFDTQVKGNTSRAQKFNMTTEKGLIQVRRQMDDLVQKRQKLLSVIADEQQLLKNSGKQASDIMLEAQQSGETDNKDTLKLKAVSMEMQDEQRLLVDHGQDLIALNDQLTKNRQWVSDQSELTKINNESSRAMLQQHYAVLNDQEGAKERTQDLIEEQRQKTLDQQVINQQRIADQMQRMQDLKNR